MMHVHNPAPTCWAPIKPVGEHVWLHMWGAQLQHSSHTGLKGVDVQLEL